MSKEAIKYITAMLAAFGPDEAISMTKETWAKIHEAMQALAQPEQEPVAWMYQDKSTHEVQFQKHMRAFVDHSRTSEVPLYSEPLANHEFQCVCGAVWCGDEMVHLPDKRPQPSKPWVGLSTDEIYDMYNEPRSDAEMVEFARAIEAKLKDKNGY